MRQEFVRFTDEQMFEKMELATKNCNALVTEYSTPLEGNRDPDRMTSSLADINVSNNFQ